MTDAYIGLEDETDPDAIAQDAFDYIASKVAGFEPSPADPMTVLVETQAQEQSVERSLASRTADSIFRFFGVLVDVPPLDATRATVGSTWTLSDDDGHTIEAGKLVGLRDPAGELIAFRVVNDVTVAALATETGTGEVILEAVNAGAAGSGLSGPVELIDAFSFVASIALTGVTTGGEDAESNSDYLGRLSTRLRLQAPRPIIPRDFEVLARDVAGVDRAVALDGYNPADQTSGNERMVAVAIIDETGAVLSQPTKDDVDELLQSQRETTFVVNVIDPTYTTIDVTFIAVAHAGFDVAAVEAAAEAAVSDFLSPVNWGQPPAGEERAWVNTTVVRIWEVLEAVQRVEGIDYVTALTIGARKSATIAAVDDVVTSTAHGYAADDPVIFRALTGGAPLVVGTTYFVRDVTANTFKLAATQGGVAIDVTSDATDATVVRLAGVDLSLTGAAPLPQAGTIAGTVTAP